MNVPLLGQLSLFWKNQTPVQRIVLITLVVAAAIMVPVLISWAGSTDYVVAYSSLSEEDAGEIVQKLSESNIDYQLKGTTTIMVPSDKVYEVRLQMAREGLPKSSAVGYELFSGNTLGMTEFTQRVNYQRALEGELERTIGSLEPVQAVRVHVVQPEKTLLSSDQQPTTASVTIQLKPGRTLDAAQVRAITQLVSSSVEGLQAENVVVVDTQGMLLAGGAENGSDAGASQSDSRRAAEASAAAEIRQKVQSMLDGMLGPNRALVQASVSMDWTQREVTTNEFSPTPSAIRSSQKVTENYANANGTTGGVPGAASNLPTPVATVAAGASPSSYSRSEETVNYEISQTQSHSIIVPGTINRVTLSVMVDNLADADQINKIKAAVAAAAGIDETRGDQIVVESVAFDHSFYEKQVAEMEETSQKETYYQYGAIGGAVLIVLILFFYFLGLTRRLRKSSRQTWTPVMKPVGEMVLPSPAAAASALPPQPVRPPAAIPAVQPVEKPPEKTIEELKLELPQRTQTASQMQDDQRARVITRLSEESPATVAEIIQIWLSEDDKNHG